MASSPPPETPAAGPHPALVWLLAAVAALAWLGLAGQRPGHERLWGDEGTFVAMTASLARDGDLAFGPADRAWATERLPGAGVTVILQRTAAGVAYSKPILYPLVAAPFYAAAGEAGMVAANLAAVGLALLLAWALLRRLGGPGRAGMTLLAFAAASALPAYLLWRMSDALQAALGLAGLVLAAGCLRLARPGEGRLGRLLDTRWAAVAGGIALGGAASMRLPNLALLGAAALALALLGRRRRAVVATVAALATFGALSAATAGLTGAANPYRADRSSFNADLGYPAAGPPESALVEAPDSAGTRFDTAPATRREALMPRPDARTAYSALYLVAGRHSGLLAYFPAALVLVGFLLARGDRLSAACGLAAAAMAAFYLLWLPENYFGGATFVGNRYLLSAYPALLVGLARLPPARLWLPVWALAAAVGVSASISIERPSTVDRLSQSHAGAGVLRLLPYESTAREIDGQRDRYWAGDFVRFVDGFAEVGDDAFRLDSSRPAAEILVAAARQAPEIVLLVAADRPRAVVEYADWGRALSYPLEPAGDVSRRLVRIEPSPAWRRHRFWWEADTAYRVHLARLSVRSPDGRPVTASIRYLGDGQLLERPLARRVDRLAAPDRAPAGGRSSVAVELVNTGSWTWSSDGSLPVFLSYRIYGPDGAKIGEGPRRPIPPVDPGERLATELEVVWPVGAGEVDLEVDLIVRHLAWFGERGPPAPRRPVTLVAP